MRSGIFLLMVLGIIAVLVAGCAQQETAKPTPETTQTPVPKSTPIETHTPAPSVEYASLKELAEKIRSGEIDVGNDYSMSLNGRFHTIHAKVLGMQCTSCHISSFSEDVLYRRKYEKPAGAPGVVDRGVCLGCHKEGGIATPWYNQADY